MSLTRDYVHQAVQGRIVAGDKRIVDSIDTIKRRVIQTPRDKEQLLRDALKMWDRISQHRINDVPAQVMNSKLCIGGLMQSEYLASLLVLTHGVDLACESVAFEHLLEQSIKDSELANLPDIIQFWRIQQLWERLLGKSGQNLDSIPSKYLTLLLEQSEVSSLDQLIEKKTIYSKQIDDAMQTLFADYPMDDNEVEEWVEKSVIWH